MNTVSSSFTGNFTRLRGLLIAAALLLGGGLLDAAPERWSAAIDALTASDANRPPAEGGILFVGSSTITRWNKRLASDFPAQSTIGRGFGGSTIEDSIFYADRIVLPYKPRLVVFYAGENDIAIKRTPERVAADFTRFCDLVLNALPGTRILYIGMKPSPKRWALQPQFDAANALIASFCARTPRTVFFDIKPIMLDADGKPRAELFTEDNLHMNAEGYRLWREILAPLLREEATTSRPPAALR